jgi:hypothetical protein
VIALGAALVVQLALALLLGGGGGMAPASADTKLLPFDIEAVTGIEIQMPAETDGDAPADAEGDPCEDGWTLPDLGRFPGQRHAGAAVAGQPRRPDPAAAGRHQRDAQQRFKVADDAFERRLTLRGADGELATLIVGDSPGFRRVFARVAGEDAVYDLRLALFDLSAEQRRLARPRPAPVRPRRDLWRRPSGCGAPRVAAKQGRPGLKTQRGLLETSRQNAEGHVRPAGDAETQRYALFAHCFTCGKDIAAASRISRALAERGIAVLRFDFTGLGNSDGDFANTSFTSNVQDLIAAAAPWRKITAPALLIGHSLGGAAVLAAAPQLPSVEAVVTIASPATPKHVEHLFSGVRGEMQSTGEAEVQVGRRRFRVRSSSSTTWSTTPTPSTSGA